jgi:hypothetical protein
MDSVQFGGFKQNKTKKYKLKLSKFVEAFKLITYTLHIYIYKEIFKECVYIIHAPFASTEMWKQTVSVQTFQKCTFVINVIARLGYPVHCYS